MKLMIMPKNKQDITNTLNSSDAYLIGLKDLSVNMPSYFNKDELIELISYIKSFNKEVYIALTKNMHNTDISYLKEIMILLDSLLVDGISYYDIAVVNIKRELGLKVPLIWNQEHLTNNYITSDYWYKFGSEFTMLSSEITLEEVKEIIENGKAKMILPIFGYLPMMVSKRHLINNYLEEFKLDDKSDIFYLEYKGEEYPITDDINGSLIYSSKVLNGIKASLEVSVDYLLLNSYLISDDIFYKVVEKFKNVNLDNVLEYEKEIDSLLNTDRGFLYKETIYKVKKDA